MIIVIGRGHSGTRAIAHTLYASGVYMGETVNSACDLVNTNVGIENINILLRTISHYVTSKSDTEWDFSVLDYMNPPNSMEVVLSEYLRSIFSQLGPSGFKIPQLTLLYPWLIKLYPDAQYIHVVRDPRDAILGGHGGGSNLERLGIPDVSSTNLQYRRAVSYKYHLDIVNQSPRPENLITVYFENFVMNQEYTLSRLEDYLDMKLGRIIVRPETVGRWHDAPEEDYDFDFLKNLKFDTS